jgi:hypothetical protein
MLMNCLKKLLADLNGMRDTFLCFCCVWRKVVVVPGICKSENY